jgi:DNA polymerase
MDFERAIVKPGVVVALGATAARSLMGRTVTIGKVRGRPVDMPDGGTMVAAIHPSYLLRIEDARDKRAQYRSFVRDLTAGTKAAR